MTAQDKLGLGMLLFLVFFVVAFLLVPREVYQKYRSSVRSRSRRRVVGLLSTSVFALAVPYFYDVLVGFDNRSIAFGLQLLISIAAYGVLLDIAHFAYRNYWAPALAKRRQRD